MAAENGNRGAVFEIALDHKRRVLWASFPGVFTHEDLAAIDAVTDVAEEADPPLAYVFDFSASTGTGEMFRSEILHRGQRPRAISGMRRVIVAPTPGIRSLAQIFSAAQAMIGSSAPTVVRAATDVQQVLGCETLDLKRTDFAALRDLLRAERQRGHFS